MRHLKAFQIFHTAATSKNFTEAATKLCLTHGAISKQIKVLEDYVGKPLFVRHGRHVSLTLDGETLAHYTQDAFSTLQVGIDKVIMSSHTAIDVSCEPTLTMRWLMPRLVNFQDQHPDIDVRLSTAGGSVNLQRAGFSLAIRRDDFTLDQDYDKVHLVEEWVGPVCSPEYWQTVCPSEANENASLKASSLRLLHTHTRATAWQTWATDAKQTILLDGQHRHFDHFYFCLQAAIDGLGIAIGSYPLVKDDLARGALIAPFGFIPSHHNYVVYKERHTDDSQHTAFISWLQQQLSQMTPTDSTN
jgi:LysR family transcriptional regulator, glycine cleavage system transcriptional activator